MIVVLNDSIVGDLPSPLSKDIRALIMDDIVELDELECLIESIGESLCDLEYELRSGEL